jgi:pSer/pThr/pTyr-binding forkhead associated (FHA) protein
MLMHLVPLSNGPLIPLDKPIVFFGRAPECDIVLLNSRKVSRKHCCIAQIDDHFVIRDLGSMNGVRVNGKPVSREARISPGDEVQIGDVAFRMELRNQVKRAPDPRKKPSAPGAVKAPVKAPPVPSRRVDPMLLSQDLPVAIPDEDLEFDIEETQQKPQPRKAKKKADDDEILDLDDIEIIED